jgi:anti-sigma B factor antagonist
MRAKLVNEGEFTVIELSGYLDYDSHIPLNQSIALMYKENQGMKLIIDLASLEFVGSSGVSTFVKSLAPFNKMQMKPFYVGVKSEFLRLFKAFDEGTAFEISDSKEVARQTVSSRFLEWQNVPTPVGSKRTH